MKDHKASKQMDTLLEGEPSTQTTKGLRMLAENLDENFNEVKEQLAEVIALLKSDKISNDAKFESLRIENERRFLEHKKEVAQSCSEHMRGFETKFSVIDARTEDIGYFKKNPKIFIVLGVGLLLIIMYALGTADLFGFMKAIK